MTYPTFRRGHPVFVLHYWHPQRSHLYPHCSHLYPYLLPRLHPRTQVRQDHEQSKESNWNNTRLIHGHFIDSSISWNRPFTKLTSSSHFVVSGLFSSVSVDTGVLSSTSVFSFSDLQIKCYCRLWKKRWQMNEYALLDDVEKSTSSLYSNIRDTNIDISYIFRCEQLK